MSTYYTPGSEPQPLPPSPTPFQTDHLLPSHSSDDLPTGAAQPRFMGAALNDEPGIRDSLMSGGSTNGIGTPTSSVRALNAPRDSYATDREREEMSEKAPAGGGRKKWIILGLLAALIIVVLAVILPVYFKVIKPNNRSTSAAAPGSSSPTRSSSAASPTASGRPQVAITGGDGSTVTMDDGTTFVYRNALGGTWYYDENDPFNGGAQAQSWSPRINETFQYGIDKIRGVNLGGWLNTEPFIVPALYEKYYNTSNRAVDEWTLSENMRADTAGGGIAQLEDHYKTFITERDFAEIAGAGLNYVRIPIGFWAIETWDGEPYLEGVSWTYFLKAIRWARKYGLRINLDLHALPGSQNGWNHSGRLGTIGFLLGPMGYANAQRSLDIIRVIAEFISQPQYKDVVTMFGIINEPRAPYIGQDNLARFSMEAYDIIRNAGGVGEGNGPWISIHDAFRTRRDWVDVYPNADRITLDSHPYMCFQDQSSAPMSTYATRPCDSWGAAVNASSRDFGLTNAGEWSNAVTDCGLYLNGVGTGTRYEGDFPGGGYPSRGSCAPWLDWPSWDDGMKGDIRTFALATMDALQDYFFWTWKIGNSSVTGKVESPAWSYQLGLEQGWMPTDPREATGVCGNTDPWTPPFQPWQTGGAGAGNIPATARAAVSWPPESLSSAGPVSLLPSYTPTGTLATLPAPTYTAAEGGATLSVAAGNGWANAQDTQGAFVPIATCNYLDQWVDPSTPPPVPLCGGAPERVAVPSATKSVSVSARAAGVTPPPSV